MSDGHSALRVEPSPNQRPAQQSSGRPSEFTQDKADEICAQIAEGVSLRTICKAEGMPSARTVFRWLRQFEPFCQQYTRAKEESADAFVEEMQDIADEAPMMTTNKAGAAVVDHGYEGYRKNRLDTRKWLAVKLKPKKYGDRIDVQHTHTLDQLLAAVPVLADPLTTAKPAIEGTATEIKSNAVLADSKQSG